MLWQKILAKNKFKWRELILRINSNPVKWRENTFVRNLHICVSLICLPPASEVPPSLCQREAGLKLTFVIIAGVSCSLQELLDASFLLSAYSKKLCNDSWRNESWSGLSRLKFFGSRWGEKKAVSDMVVGICPLHKWPQDRWKMGQQNHRG